MITVKTTTKASIHKWGAVAMMVIGGLDTILTPIRDYLPPYVYGMTLALAGLAGLVVNSLKTAEDIE